MYRPTETEVGEVEELASAYCELSRRRLQTIITTGVGDDRGPLERVLREVAKMNPVMVLVFAQTILADKRSREVICELANRVAGVSREKT